jgi:hypothetical protein
MRLKIPHGELLTAIYILVLIFIIYGIAGMEGH